MIQVLCISEARVSNIDTGCGDQLQGCVGFSGCAYEYVSGVFSRTSLSTSACTVHAVDYSVR